MSLVTDSMLPLVAENTVRDAVDDLRHFAALLRRTYAGSPVEKSADCLAKQMDLRADRYAYRIGYTR